MTFNTRHPSLSSAYGISAADGLHCTQCYQYGTMTDFTEHRFESSVWPVAEAR